MSVETCIVKGCEIREGWPRITNGEHSVCMGHEHSFILVYRVEVNGNSFVTHDYRCIMPFIENMDENDDCMISKYSMKATEYLKLPIHTGF